MPAQEKGIVNAIFKMRLLIKTIIVPGNEIREKKDRKETLLYPLKSSDY